MLIVCPCLLACPTNDCVIKVFLKSSFLLGLRWYFVRQFFPLFCGLYIDESRCKTVRKMHTSFFPQRREAEFFNARVRYRYRMIGGVVPIRNGNGIAEIGTFANECT